jgi:hypothetical protein
MFRIITDKDGNSLEINGYGSWLGPTGTAD